MFYYGKAASLGLKSIGKSPTLKMTELIISKVATIHTIALGHDGIHALLINEDGSVYFTGIARRGEDGGDTSKNRRQQKPVKPKKITKIEGHFVVHASCNNGTSAFVTKAGKLIMFGKDTTHCDVNGFVTELGDQHITKVALGKAHSVAVNSKGAVFTFGLNNKGQCGRVFLKDKESCGSAASTTMTGDASSSSSRDPRGGGGSDTGKTQFDMTNMCDPDDHNFVHGRCRVCMVCLECTGYNITCVSALSAQSSKEHRVAGANCECGHGDAGCSKCGACFTCVKYQESMIDDVSLKEVQSSLLGRQRSRSLVLSSHKKKEMRLEEGGGATAVGGSDVERETPRVAPLPPHKVSLPTTSPVVQVACGLHHTVVLTLAGEVFTFGSNQYGQLGTGDLQPVQGPVQVKVPGLISQVAAGSNHTVLLTYKGVVYTFGNYQKGQLGRLPEIIEPTNVGHDDDMSASGKSVSQKSTDDPASASAAQLLMQRKKFLWNCAPGAAIGIGPTYGKRGSWIGASGDQTFIKIDESLVTGSMLSKVNVAADKNTIVFIPTAPLAFSCLAINRRDGTCMAHTNATEQIDFARHIQTSAALIARLESDDKCNQNVGVNEVTLQQHEIARMSQSIHEGRNHNIFELVSDEPDSVGCGGVGGKNQSAGKSASGQMKVVPQLAFCVDPCYGVLWVFDAVLKQVTAYNVIAAEMKATNFRSILAPEIALPLRPAQQITRSQASLNLLACLDILTSARDSLATCFEVSANNNKINPLREAHQTIEYQMANRFENFGGGWGYSGHSVEAIRLVNVQNYWIKNGYFSLLLYETLMFGHA